MAGVGRRLETDEERYLDYIPSASSLQSCSVAVAAKGHDQMGSVLR